MVTPEDDLCDLVSDLVTPLPELRVVLKVVQLVTAIHELIVTEGAGGRGAGRRVAGNRGKGGKGAGRGAGRQEGGGQRRERGRKAGGRGAA